LLYQWHEAIRASVASMKSFSEMAVSVMKDPANPWRNDYLVKSSAVLADFIGDCTLSYSKPQWCVRDVSDTHTQSFFQEGIIDSKVFCNLIRFFRSSDGSQNKLPKMLVVAPLSGHFPTLLRGTVETLVQNFDVYVTDWKNARDVPADEGVFNLDNYIDYIREFTELLGENLHIVSVCQPGPSVMAAVSLLAEDNSSCQPKTLTLIGCPIDTRQSPTAPNRFAQSRSLSWFEKNAVVTVPASHKGTSRLVYPGFLQLGGFMGMNIDKHIAAYRSQWVNLLNEDLEPVAAHRKFYDEYLSVMDLPAEYYLDTIKKVFQEHHLADGIMAHRGRKVDPSCIRKTALLTIEGGQDDISGIGQTRAAHDLCTNLPESLHAEYTDPEAGHYGLFHGERWRQAIAPKILDFTRQYFDKGSLR
jgi:poly(3-hydroxybutyrate) depolymerase